MQGHLILRLAAFLSAGVLLVHEGRYRLAFGSHAGTVLSARGHGYLPMAAVAVCALMAIAGGLWMHRLASGGRGCRVGPGRLGAGLALAILAVYVGQELAEGSLTAGHLVGLDTVAADGGWIAIPLAAVAGAVGGRLLAAAESVVAQGVGWAPCPTVITGPDRLWRPAGIPAALVPVPLARHLAGRAPPPHLN